MNQSDENCKNDELNPSRDEAENLIYNAYGALHRFAEGRPQMNIPVSESDDDQKIDFALQKMVELNESNKQLRAENSRLKGCYEIEKKTREKLSDQSDKLYDAFFKVTRCLSFYASPSNWNGCSIKDDLWPCFGGKEKKTLDKGGQRARTTMAEFPEYFKIFEIQQGDGYGIRNCKDD